MGRNSEPKVSVEWSQLLDDVEGDELAELLMVGRMQRAHYFSLTGRIRRRLAMPAAVHFFPDHKNREAHERRKALVDVAVDWATFVGAVIVGVFWAWPNQPVMFVGGIYIGLIAGLMRARLAL